MKVKLYFLKNISRILLIVVITFHAGCEMNSALLNPGIPLAEDGEVFVYVEPFLQESDRLKFRVDTISALKSDGTEYPLSLSFTEYGGSLVKRQRLAASGQLPPGGYKGLSIGIGKAIFRGEEGDAALLLPERPVTIDFPFTILKKKAVVVALTFNYPQSISAGFSFVPVFSAFIPEKPLLNLTGYVSNRDSHSITVFDNKTGQASSVIETGMEPGEIVLDKRARRAYVSLSGEDSVDVIDLMAGDVVNRIGLYSGDRPVGLALTPDGKTLLSVNAGSNTVSIIDPYSLTEKNRIAVGNGPESVLLDRTGKRAYVFNTQSNTISVIDVQNKSVSATISTEAGPVRGQFNRNGDKFYVLFERSPYLIAFDSNTLSVIKRVFVGAGIASLKVDTNTDFLYLGRRFEGSVDVYDPLSLLPIGVIRSGGGVVYMTIDGEGNNLCMVAPDRKELIIVNIVSRKIIAEIDVGEGAYGTAMMAER